MRAGGGGAGLLLMSVGGGCLIQGQGSDQGDLLACYLLCRLGTE